MLGSLLGMKASSAYEIVTLKQNTEAFATALISDKV